MPRFAANLTMLFTETGFLERFGAAAKAGFDAVEYLFPYDYDAGVLRSHLQTHGLKQVLHNLPAGNWAAGERGIAVYAAHRDTHFRFLRNVAIGDVIEVTRSDGKHFRYRADASSVVRFDASGIDVATQDFELVLTTCWPFDAVTPGPERYILHATLIGTDG